MAATPSSVKLKRQRWIKTFIVLCLLVALLIVVVNFLVFSLNKPTREELALEATAIAQSVGISAEPERVDLTGDVLGGSIPRMRITARRSGQPDQVFAQLTQAIEHRGYRRIGGLNPNGPLTGSWSKGKIRVDAYVDGTSGAGVQSIVVGFDVGEYRK